VGVAAGQFHVREPAAVDLDDVARELHPGPTVVTDRHLEDPAGPDGEEVGVLGVIVDDVPPGAEHLDPVHDPLAAGLDLAPLPRLAPPPQPAALRRRMRGRRVGRGGVVIRFHHKTSQAHAARFSPYVKWRPGARID
jgi:hypothetical protein